MESKSNRLDWRQADAIEVKHGNMQKWNANGNWIAKGITLRLVIRNAGQSMKDKGKGKKRTEVGMI